MEIPAESSTTRVLRGGWRELVIVFLGFGASTLALMHQVAFHLGTVARIDNGDGQFSIWNVAWVARTLVVDPLHVFDANIFYPHRWTLAYSEANLGEGLGEEEAPGQKPEEDQSVEEKKGNGVVVDGIALAEVAEELFVDEVEPKKALGLARRGIAKGGEDVPGSGDQ